MVRLAGCGAAQHNRSGGTVGWSSLCSVTAAAGRQPRPRQRAPRHRQRDQSGGVHADGRHLLTVAPQRLHRLPPAARGPHCCSTGAEGEGGVSDKPGAAHVTHAPPWRPRRRPLRTPFVHTSLTPARGRQSPPPPPRAPTRVPTCQSAVSGAGQQVGGVVGAGGDEESQGRDRALAGAHQETEVFVVLAGSGVWRRQLAWVWMLGRGSSWPRLSTNIKPRLLACSPAAPSACPRHRPGSTRTLRLSPAL